MRKESKGKSRGGSEMDANAIRPIERYCSISESLKQSCSEVNLMRQGKLPKKTWDQLKEELKKIKGDED